MRPELEVLEMRISPDATPINPAALLAQMQAGAALFQQAENLINQAFPQTSNNPFVLLAGLTATNTLFNQVTSQMEVWLPLVAQLALTGQAFTTTPTP